MAQQVKAVLELVISYLPCQCAIPGLRPPPSPALSAQEGEMQGLLGDELDWRDDDIDALSLHSTRISGNKYQPKRMTGRSRVTTSSQDDEPDQPAEEEFNVDPTSIDRHTIAELPRHAKQFEPELTIEQMAREEEEQAEKERIARRGYVPRAPIPSHSTAEEPDFGAFEQAPGGVSTPKYTDPLGAGIATDEGSNSDDDAAEVSFGLGNVSDDE